LQSIDESLGRDSLLWGGSGRNQPSATGQKPSFNIQGDFVSDAIIYLHLEPESSLPEIANEPTRMVVIVEAEVSPEWQSLVSDWIVRSGCLYMMAWGIECSSWDDSVDWANINKYGEDPIPDDGFVITTWHSDEPLEEVFWFSKNCAIHPVVDLNQTIILDISTENQRVQLLHAYAAA
jgi:hypothetical protein